MYAYSIFSFINVDVSIYDNAMYAVKCIYREFIYLFFLERCGMVLETDEHNVLVS